MGVFRRDENVILSTAYRPSLQGTVTEEVSEFRGVVGTTEGLLNRVIVLRERCRLGLKARRPISTSG